MLLALDVGNSNTTLGLFRITAPTPVPPAPSADATAPADSPKPHPQLVTDWRITTPYTQTADELGVLFQTLFHMRGIDPATVTGIAVSSVVPPLDATLRKVCESFFHIRPLFIEPGVKTGLPVLTDNPSEVGADRVVNCVAAFDLFGGPTIVVDLGTAINFDVVSAKGEFLGGAIAPGIGISADALFSRAARLTRVEIKRPSKIIGTNTTDNIQIGLYYGFIGLVDGILERMIAELGPNTKTVATGGLAKLIAADSKFIQHTDEMITLNGLRLIYERNLDRHRRR
jgi:type III pantothenate kinase